MTDIGPVHAENQRTASWLTHRCELVWYHAPQPVITEYHHTKPVYLQNRLYGAIQFGADLWLCSNCHESVHAWLYWLLRERKEPPYIGRAAKAEAERTFEWYTSEARRLGKESLLEGLDV